MSIFHGPIRRAEYPIPVEASKYFHIDPRPENNCKMGHHFWPTKAFVTLIPNGFPLCYGCFSRLYPFIEKSLKLKYAMEAGRDWF